MRRAATRLPAASSRPRWAGLATAVYERGWACRRARNEQIAARRGSCAARSSEMSDMDGTPIAMSRVSIQMTVYSRRRNTIHIAGFFSADAAWGLQRKSLSEQDLLPRDVVPASGTAIVFCAPMASVV